MLSFGTKGVVNVLLIVVVHVRVAFHFAAPVPKLDFAATRNGSQCLGKRKDVLQRKVSHSSKLRVGGEDQPLCDFDQFVTGNAAF